MRCTRRTFSLLVLAVLAGCDGPDAERASGKIAAVCTVGMVGDLVRHVGGAQVEVAQIMGPGVDPHLYKATRDDVRDILLGDIVFYSGLMLEGKMNNVLQQIGRRRPVFAVTERIDHDFLLQPADFEGHYDPHVWMDVHAWREGIPVVVRGLSDLDPTHAEHYADRGAEYYAKLTQLHAYAERTIATIPADNRVLITSHDAFNYFGRAYGLEVIGVQGLSTESEAGLQQINELVDLLVDRRIGAVFVETSVPQKNIRALIDGANSRGHEVYVGGELYSDAMGPAGTYEGTYIGMIEHNVNTVVTALGGTIPEGGFQATWKL